MPEAGGSVTGLQVVTTGAFEGYELLDAGAGRKLERFGAIIVDRPEPQALWRPRLDKQNWQRAHAAFSASGNDEERGRWRIAKDVPDSWPVPLPLPGIPAGCGCTHSNQKITVLCKLQGLWHLGLFPEQAPHWTWMLQRLASVQDGPPRVLNLFGYTGAASLLAAATGSEVTHLDASRKAISWGRENQVASKLEAAKIRWILDDAPKFVAREVRRGRTYHVILIDPPKFGRGPEGEVWDLFADLPELLTNCARLLTDRDAAMILTVYALRASALAFDQLMRDTLMGRAGAFDTGELAIRAGSGCLVPTSLYTRWASEP